MFFQTRYTINQLKPQLFSINAQFYISSWVDLIWFRTTVWTVHMNVFVLLLYGLIFQSIETWDKIVLFYHSNEITLFISLTCSSPYQQNSPDVDMNFTTRPMVTTVVCFIPDVFKLEDPFVLSVEFQLYEYILGRNFNGKNLKFRGSKNCSVYFKLIILCFTLSLHLNFVITFNLLVT